MALMAHADPNCRKAEYLERAREALALAIKATTPYHRTILLGIARDWKHFANLAEKNEGGTV
jgi:hypothetical protein